MLKSDFHLHAGIDEHHKLDHTPKELIDKAYKEGYGVLAITNHNTFTYNPDLARYARKRNILLIPGTERIIKGKDVILLNVTKNLAKKIKTFEDLEKHKDENLFVIAPHPFYPDPRSLHSRLEQNIKLFDAIEYSHFYLSWLNWFNEKAQETAKKHNKPMVGTSDCHTLKQFGMTYSMVDAERNIDSVFEAIRKKRIKIMTKPLPAFKAALILSKIYLFY